MKANQKKYMIGQINRPGFIEEHWQFIDAVATIHAITIAQKTGRWNIEDHKQEIFLFLVKRIEGYQPGRSSPHTFINMVARSAKVSILRQLYRYKNQMITRAASIENYV